MEENNYIPVYARTQNGVVTDIFSEPFAKTNGRGGIKDTDIVIDAENTEYGGERNYKVFDDNGLYNYTLVDGQLVTRDKTAELRELSINQLRNRRDRECFCVVNRGELWYSRLTAEQKAELNEWYNAWLNVTATEIVPLRPSWIDR